MPIRQRAFALRTTAIYIVLAAAWITIGDLLVVRLATDSDTAVRMQMLKGWAFVLLSGGFVYWLAHLTRHRWFTTHAELNRRTAGFRYRRAGGRRRPLDTSA